MGRSIDTEAFVSFMEETEPRIRRALIAGYGSQLAGDATQEAFEYAWEHWNKVRRAKNPAGYVYRVGAHCAARARRRMGERSVPLDLSGTNPSSAPWVEPKLNGALDRLSRQQRTAIVLVHGFDWTYREVGELMSVRKSTVQRHVMRAMAKLREDLGVRDAAA